MTLKEKFKKEKIYINPYSFKLTTESVETFEQIADDYAIEFLDWYGGLRLNQVDGKKTKELLEIFKKEKDL